MNSAEIATYAGDVIAACAIIAAVWKPAATSPLYPLYAIINAVAVNMGKAANDPTIPHTGAASPDQNGQVGTGPKG